MIVIWAVLTSIKEVLFPIHITIGSQSKEKGEMAMLAIADVKEKSIFLYA